jgi:hypothetical protein
VRRFSRAAGSTLQIHPLFLPFALVQAKAAQREINSFTKFEWGDDVRLPAISAGIPMKPVFLSFLLVRMSNSLVKMSYSRTCGSNFYAGISNAHAGMSDFYAGISRFRMEISDSFLEISCSFAWENRAF